VAMMVMLPREGVPGMAVRRKSGLNQSSNIGSTAEQKVARRRGLDGLTIPLFGAFSS